MGKAAQGLGQVIRGVLLWGPSRPLSGARGVQVVLRSLHIMAMSLVLGAIYQGGDLERLRLPILVTLATGLLLLVVDLARGCLVITQGSGFLVLLKLILLGVGNLIPAQRLPWYLAATFVAAIGSHMSGDWRHFSLITWRVEKQASKT